jgi:uncharacterized membrane protein
MIGYCLGSFYVKEYDAIKRQKGLMLIGVFVTMFFIVLRFANVYGDPSSWIVQRNWVTTVLSFFNVTKYPPSLLFLSMTMGPALIFLSVIEKKTGRWTKVVSVYGRVPFFYFLIHFFLLHLICLILFFLNGNSLSAANTGLIHFRPETFGYSLGVVYLIWITVVVVLYPVCKWYDQLKSSHKKWWLSYL